MSTLKSTTPAWVLSLRDISPHRGKAEYELPDKDGRPRRVVLDKRKRQVIDTMLFQGPLYCASTVRIGDIVFRLKEDDEVFCTTETTLEGRRFYAAPVGMRFIGEMGGAA